MVAKVRNQKLAWKLLEACPDAVEVFDLDGSIIYINDTAARRYAKSARALMHNNIWNLFPPSKTAHRKTVVKKVTRSGIPVQFTDRFENCWVNVLICPLPGPDGKTEAIVTYTQDISRQVNAEERLKLVSLQLFTNQEDERRRIAQDLHDDLGQSMTALILDLKVIQHNAASGHAGVEDQIKGTIQIVEEMMRHIRRVLYELRPPSFDTMSVAKVLEVLCSSMALSTGLRVLFSSSEQLPAIPNAQATALYRLVQEGINNVVKHASAGSVWINLDYVDGEVTISVEDDGHGFDPAVRSSYGMGLQGLAERYLMLSGNFDIESQPGKGTRIYGSFPVANSAAD